MKKLINVARLNELFGITGSDWLEIDTDDYEPLTGVTPCNDLGGEDYFWNVADDAAIADRNRKIKETYENFTDAQWVTLIAHRVKGNPQSNPTTVDGQDFPSQNSAARYLMNTYNVSRNTAIRYLQEGRHPTDPRQKGRKYKGDYKGSKYD